MLIFDVKNFGAPYPITNPKSKIINHQSSIILTEPIRILSGTIKAGYPGKSIRGLAFARKPDWQQAGFAGIGRGWHAELRDHEA